MKNLVPENTSVQTILNSEIKKKILLDSTWNDLVKTRSEGPEMSPGQILHGQISE